MKTFFAAIKRSPKLAALVAALVGVVVVPAALLAWGPDRPLYTMASPADHVTFNSITDNPDQGDERNFVRIREAGVGNYAQNIQLQAGHEYEVSVFYHNNASSTLNDSGTGIAHNTTMEVQMPTDVQAGKSAEITGVVSADNASPQSVWDTALGDASSDMDLRYEAGSATVYSKGAVNGQHLSDSILNGPVQLGYDSLNGDVPGCNDYEGWVVFKFKAVAPSFTVEKTVAKVGSESFAKSVAVNPGDEVNYSIEYHNTGSVDQNDVVVRDKMPAGVSYEAGTTRVATPNSNGQWVNIDENDVVTDKGINIGNFGPESNAFVTFKAKVAGADALKCGVNTLVNTATVETDNGSQSDTATVTVNKPCANVPGELPQTGMDSGLLSAIGLGTLTAGIAYAIRSMRVRNLLRG
jgi:uncharacterized repeat protein (TIGR01451 family)/LPXTG-motif cell wall-anchored protein